VQISKQSFYLSTLSYSTMGCQHQRSHFCLQYSNKYAYLHN